MLRALTIGAGLLLLFPAISLALPTSVDHANLPNCDPLFVPLEVDELGIPPLFTLFPDELIDATDTITNLVACPLDDPLIPNTLVVMTNLTGIAWKDVWYVADPRAPVGAVGTSISNFDGLVDAAGPVFDPGDAFKIDSVGLNRPLVFESIAFNGIFSPGETWHFIIDDYVNTGGLAASLFDSFGVASASPGGPPSSGSIIAVPVPEPATCMLMLIGLGAVVVGRRS